MTDTLQNPEELLPLTPAVFNILLALVDGEKHGCAIMLEVEAKTEGQSGSFEKQVLVKAPDGLNLRGAFRRAYDSVSGVTVT